MSFLSQPISLIPIGVVRQINGIRVNVIINEETNDTLTITKQPVQQGASITDHAYKEPTELSMTAYFRDNPTFADQVNQLGAVFNSIFNRGEQTEATGSLAATYKAFLDLQNSRVPFKVITPKRIYNSMLISSLGMTTDKSTENCLALHFRFQEVILVTLTTSQVPKEALRIPQSNQKTEQAGKKQSILLNAAQVVAPGIGGAGG